VICFAVRTAVESLQDGCITRPGMLSRVAIFPHRSISLGGTLAIMRGGKGGGSRALCHATRARGGGGVVPARSHGTQWPSTIAREAAG
jgi:hypothetical protein